MYGLVLPKIGLFYLQLFKLNNSRKKEGIKNFFKNGRQQVLTTY